jgi:predicted dienelactone hydrolase
VLLSHGSGGDPSNLAWLAETLATHGYVVAAVDHAGDRLGDSSVEGRFAVWRRPAEVTRVLSSLLADPALGPRIDRHRIAAAGHSSGGTTVLELAGARVQPQSYLRDCRGPQAGPDCALIADLDVANLPDLANRRALEPRPACPSRGGVRARPGAGRHRCQPAEHRRPGSDRRVTR